MKKLVGACAAALAVPVIVPLAFAGTATASLAALVAPSSTISASPAPAPSANPAPAAFAQTGLEEAEGNLAGLAAVAYAEGQIGTPYEWGGERAGVGFDCSGLAQAAWRAAGVSIPRVAQDQYDAGPALLPGEELQPGDLVFFGAGASDVTHVGIVVDPDGEMIDAPHTGARVRMDRFPIVPGSRWGDDIFVGATRP